VCDSWGAGLMWREPTGGRVLDRRGPGQLSIYALSGVRTPQWAVLTRFRGVFRAGPLPYRDGSLGRHTGRYRAVAFLVMAPGSLA